MSSNVTESTTKTPQSPALLTVDEVAAELRIDPRSVRNLIEAKLLKGSRLGKGYKVSRKELDRFIAAI